MTNKRDKVFLITRIKELKKPKEKKDFNKWLKVFLKSGLIAKIFIISDKRQYSLIKKIDPQKKIKFIRDDENPTSSISMNKAIEHGEFIKGKPKSFIVASKEVGVEDGNIKKLISELENNNMLCVGYKFKITEIHNKYDEELKKYYKDKELIAYRVPWNTCIIWNYSLFENLVVEFDEVCNNPFGKLKVCVDNVVRETEYKGMEDGLAIAKAASKDKKIKFKLLDKEKKLKWNLKGRDILKHRVKLARKNEVLLSFMATRNYSVDDLLKAEES